MAGYHFVVLSNPAPGAEDEYNDWYTNTHVPDVLKIPGFEAAQRYAWAPKAADEAAPAHRYMAVYEVETDDVAATFAALSATAGGPDMRMSKALDRKSLTTMLFRPITPRVTRD